MTAWPPKLSEIDKWTVMNLAKSLGLAFPWILV